MNPKERDEMMSGAHPRDPMSTESAPGDESRQPESSVLRREDAQELSEALGQVGQGGWRTIARLIDMGVPEALGMGGREWAERYHGYLKMPLAERREAVAELTEQGKSTREVADVLGIGHATVARDVRAVSGKTGERAQEDIEGVPVRDTTSSPSHMRLADPRRRPDHLR
jgi:hypothetical protein